MNFWLRWIGAAISCISIFNLIRKYFNVGLAPILHDLVTFYQSVFYPILGAFKYIQPFIAIFRGDNSFNQDLLILLCLVYAVFTKSIFSRMLKEVSIFDSIVGTAIFSAISLWLIYLMMSIGGVILIFMYEKLGIILTILFLIAFCVVWFYILPRFTIPAYAADYFEDSMKEFFETAREAIGELLYIFCVIGFLFVINFYAS